MPPPETRRIEWVDHAKGLCIILVVLMHSTLGVEKAIGEHGALGVFVAWAQPFRMPDFFLISGLFLSRRIDAPWRDFIDRKVVHFLYFYALWMTIQLTLKAPGLLAEAGAAGLARLWLTAFVEPFGTLWFIHVLPVFFLVTRALRHAPPALVFALAAALEILPVRTGATVVDEFAARYVYFFAGYWLAGHVFRFAAASDRLATPALVSALFVWGAAHTAVFAAGLSGAPVIGLTLGFAGAAAVVATGVLLARLPVGPAIRHLGARSISVYLAFFLFMAASRAALVGLAPELGADAIALIVTAAGLAGPLVLRAATCGTALGFLFVRPNLAKLGPSAWTVSLTGHVFAPRPPRLR